MKTFSIYLPIGILYVFIRTSFLVSSPFEFHFERDDIFIIDKYQKVMDSYQQREEKNRIHLNIQDIKDNYYQFQGTFTTYIRYPEKEISFRKEEEIVSNFKIQKNGIYIVPEKSLVPNFQSIPTFPSIKEGNSLPKTWEKPAKEVIYIPSIPLKIIVPFMVHYQYLGTEEIAYLGKKVKTHKIQYSYQLNHKVVPGKGPIQYIYGKTKGWIYFSTQYQIPLYDEQKLFYEFIMKNGKKFHEFFLIKSHYRKIKKLNQDKIQNQLSKIQNHIQVKKTSRGISIQLNHILFPFNSHQLTDNARKVLDSIYKVLKQYPGREIQVEGHTDNTGNENYNKKLSEKRAKEVAEYLIQKGLNPDQISYKGYGSKKPLVPNSSPENRSKNRRVEILIITK